MKVMKALLVVGSMVASFAPRAEVTVDFHSDINPVMVAGEEIPYSFFSKSSFSLPDGKNQVVLRMSKLVEKLGEKEKFNSKTFVLTFSSENSVLFIEPGSKVVRVEQAQRFDKSPSFIISDKKGNQLAHEVAELPNLGGIKRDYEKELAKFNAEYYPDLLTSTIAVTEVSSADNIKVDAHANENTEPNMFKYWLEQANQEEIEQFTDIALRDRKDKAIVMPESASQPVQMLGYWYNKSNSEERKQILSHLVGL